MRTLRGAAVAGSLLVLLLAAGSARAQQAPKKPPAKPAAPAASAAPAAAGAAYAQRFASLCAACHGPNGVSQMEGTPSLAGQPALYAITQLFLYREGRRSSEAMTAVAKTMKDEDLRGFSDFIGTLPAASPPPPATPTDAARMAKGKALAQEHKCSFCHGADLAGGQGVARLAGQREEYLKAVLRGYKTGERAAYTRAMPEAVGPVSPEDLDTLAYYAARFTGP